MTELQFGDWDTPSARAIEKIPPFEVYGGGVVTLLQLDYHRNGSGGAGFYTGFIRINDEVAGDDIDDDAKDAVYLFTTFNHGGDETSVICYDDIEKEHRDGHSVWGVQFMYNSYRGADYYGPAIRQFIADERFLTYIERDGIVKTFNWAEREKVWRIGPEEERDPTPDLIESRFFQQYADDNPREYAKGVETAAEEVARDKERAAKSAAELEAELEAQRAETRSYWDADKRLKAYKQIDIDAMGEALENYVIGEDWFLDDNDLQAVLEAALRIDEAREILGEDSDS